MYAFPFQTPCYGIAALFCLFACLNTIGYIPYDRITVQWHFWLSVGSVVLFIAWFVWLRAAAQHSVTAPSLGASGTILAVLFLSSVPIFLIAQAWFVIGLVRAILRMRHS